MPVHNLTRYADEVLAELDLTVCSIHYRLTLPRQTQTERIMRAAAKRGFCLEINSQPDRMDLSDVYCKMAKELGVKLVISTDAHRTSDLDYMCLGIAQARRGWLEADDVLNTRKVPEMLRLLERSE